MKKISVIIPCFNEELNIEDSYNLLKDIFSKLPDYDYEIIFADNDSKDNSEMILRTLASKDTKVKVILNNRNFGVKNSCINAVLSSNGDAFIILMCDRQDPYEMIPRFIEEWDNGAKVVWGQKKSSKEHWLKYKLRTLYYKIVKKLSYIEQYEHVIGYGIYDRSILEHIKNINIPEIDLRFTLPALGYKPVLIPYEQQIREKGKTSYNFFSYFDTALNSLVHSSKIPMKIMTYIGLIFCFISLLTGTIYFIYKLFNWDTFSAGIIPMVILFSIFASLQLLFMGIIGEYILAILDKVHFSKYVIEKERINF